MAEKAVRLNKIAREFNVGIQTIVDFLAEKGVEIESKPNAKVEAEVYTVLLDAFQSDKQSKEKSVEISSRTREERMTITLESSKKTVDVLDEEVIVADPVPEPPKVEEKIAEPEKPIEEKKEVVEAKIVSPVEEVPEVEVPEKVVETAKEEKEEPVVKEEPAPEAKADESKEDDSKEEKKEIKSQVDSKIEVKVPKTGLKVVGKVDLEPKKKPAEKKKEAETKTEAKVEAKAEEKPKPEVKEPAKPAVPELIEARAEKLTGPTVIGKIELPKVPSKKKKVSLDASKKRKRKRVAKVDIEKQAKDQRRKPRPTKGRSGAKPEVSEKAIQKEIKDTLARLSGGKKSKSAKLRRAKRDAVAQRTEEELERAEIEKSVLKLTEFVTVQELANMMDVSATDIISACMALGIFASINQRLDAETITLITEEFGYTVEFVSAEVQDAIIEEEDKPEDLLPRAPIVTVMGHVDHGKTSLLDYIRKANVIKGEAGGITQHIGAYNVPVGDDNNITFLDTPGHEAFTAMRARGAQVTDLAIIVVAADDSVMPQTKEAISHAQAANIPMIFAINKIDRPNANPDKIKEELSQMNILVEDWGGKYQSQEISAKTGENIDVLLEKVILEAELLELKANPDRRAMGTMIEATLDKGRGYVTTMLIEKGTMRVGDVVLAGQWSGKVKAMFNERGTKMDEAGPSVPVSMLGMGGAPNAGDKFHVMADDKEAKNIALKRQQLQREQSVRAQKHITIEEIGRRIAIGEFKELNLIVKGDVDGSVEALTDSLQKLSTEKVQVRVIHKAVGEITESDVLLATASDAIIVGFQVRPSAAARKLAEAEEIQLRMYSVIYAAIEEMKDAMEGLLSAKIEEKVVGSAEIRETFKISKVGTIAGCIMLDGKIQRSSKVRVIREGIVVFTGFLGSLKRYKDDAKEVTKGQECGLNIEKYNDILVADIIEAYEEFEVKQTL